MAYWDYRFLTDSLAVVQVSCSIRSEGRGMGVYVHEVEDVVLWADRFDDEPRPITLTEDEQVRLDDEVAESEEAYNHWIDWINYEP